MSSPGDVVKAYMTAFEAADPGGVASLFSDDGAILAPPMPTIRGRDAIKTTMEAVFAAIKVRVEDMAIDRVQELGDAAFVEAQSSEAVTNVSENTTEVHHYRELFCMERDGDDWKIASYMFNNAPG